MDTIKTMNIIGNKHIFLSFSGALVVLSVLAIGVFGLKQGIDFTGGTFWQVRFEKAVVTEDIRSFIHEDLKESESVITEETSTKSLSVRLREIDEATHQLYGAQLREKFGQFEELRFESIGPVIGSELRVKAYWAFILVLVLISLYVALVFRKVSYPVSSWKYGIVTLGTLFHDAIVPVGMTAVMGHYYGIEVGINLVVAILVVIGFSVHDTIVVMDRTRENLRIMEKKVSFADLVNMSVNQTIARSINTSLTLIFVLVALYLLGPASLSYFILVILVGTVLGTYSSIYVASSLIVLWNRNI